MLRRGGRAAVVVQWVVVEETLPANAGQAAQRATDDGGQGLGVGGAIGGAGEVHGSMVRRPLASCTESRSTERLPRVPAYWTARDVEQLRADLDGHTVDSLAAALSVDRARAARFLRGDLMWTDYQRAKLARGRAA